MVCACRVEGPGRSCVEGEGFLQKSPSKEPHFTDVSRGSGGGLGYHWELGCSNEALWGSDGRPRDSGGEPTLICPPHSPDTSHLTLAPAVRGEDIIRYVSVQP